MLLTIVVVLEFFLSRKHLAFGFFTDDWLFLSAYRTAVSNPLLDLLSAWKELGAHWFAHSYYIGVLHNFFGLNYFSYHVFNTLLKAISVLTIYPLVYLIFKDKVLAFLTTIIYAIHFSPFGTLDNASRGEDFLAIAVMNFFIFYYIRLISEKISNILYITLVSSLLFLALLIDSTRLFPLLLLVPLIDLSAAFLDKKGFVWRLMLRRWVVIYSPILLLFLFSPGSILIQLSYVNAIFTKLKVGNFQLFLTPLAALGSTFVPRELWTFLGGINYHQFDLYMASLIKVILPFLGLDLLITAIFSLSIRFFIRNLLGYVLFGYLVFLLANHWLFINSPQISPVDPGIYLLPALIGGFVIITGVFSAMEWQEKKTKSKLLLGIFMAPLFSLLFTALTWLFADPDSIFMGVHAYLNIPSIGTSLFIAVILSQLYHKWCLKKPLLAVVMTFLIVLTFFAVSLKSIDKYFNDWLDNGLGAADQERIRYKFWNTSNGYNVMSQVKKPLIYLDSLSETKNGAFYSETIIWRLASWFDLQFNSHHVRPYQLCEIMVLDKQNLFKYTEVVDINGVKKIKLNQCNKENYFSMDQFFAFRLKDRSIYPIHDEMLKELGLK